MKVKIDKRDDVAVLTVSSHFRAFESVDTAIESFVSEPP